MVKNTKETIYTGRERHEKKPLHMCFHLARPLSNTNVVGKIFWVRISSLAPSLLCLGSLLRTPGHFKPRAGCWGWWPTMSRCQPGLAGGLNSFPLSSVPLHPSSLTGGWGPCSSSAKWLRFMFSPVSSWWNTAQMACSSAPPKVKSHALPWGVGGTWVQTT